MKKIISLLLLMMITMLCKAQSIEVKYSVYSKQRKEQIDKIMRNPNNQEHNGLFAGLNIEKEDSFCLVVKNRQSSYVRLEPDEDLREGGGVKIILVNASYSEEDHAVYKDLSNRTIVEVRDLLAEAYIIEKTAPQYSWKLSSDSKDIMGLKCYRAVLNDTVTAWFCPEIPISEGPDLYWGLPGLILDLEDNRNIYRCISIDTNSRSELAGKKHGKKVSAERFEEIKKLALER